MLLRRKLPCRGLLERPALRGHQNHARLWSPQGLNRRKQRLGPQHHPLPAAAWRLINAPMLVLRPIPKLVTHHIHQARRTRALDDRITQGRQSHLGKQCHDVDPHDPTLAADRLLPTIFA